MSGYKLDAYEQIANELRGLITKLGEAQQWFIKQDKQDEALACDKCIQHILKATFLISKNTAITQQPAPAADKYPTPILTAMATAAA